MILQALYELYSRLEKDSEYAVAPLGFSLQQITYSVVLNPDGTLHSIEDVRQAEGKKMRPRLLRVPGYTKSSGSGFNPGFMWDNTGYMLGYKPKDTNSKRTKESFQAFKKRHLDLQAEIHSARFDAVCRFLSEWDPAKAVELPILDEVNPGYGVFQIRGETAYIHEDEAVLGWWLNEQKTQVYGNHGHCLITGSWSPIVETQPKIKRVGEQSESLLVSFNAPSFESYQKTQSLNAPISEEAAFKYATALNALLAGPMSDRHRFRLGDSTVVFWTDQPSPAEDYLADFFAQAAKTDEQEKKENGQDESVLDRLKLFLSALSKGREAYGELDAAPDRTKFCMLGLTGQAKGRIGVRFFYQDSLANLLEHLRQHFKDIELVPWTGYGKENRWRAPEYPELWQILDETAPRRQGKVDRDQIPPLLAGPLLRSVIMGQRYPEGLYQALLRRIHADRQINYIRCAVLKGCLNRNQGKEIDMSLDQERREPAYWTGCLFAALEKTQYDALGEVGASIRDRYYGSASATPRSVFPRLLRTYQHHLAKMERGKISRERLVRDIMARLQDFPAHLDLTGQGLFALGYYHQMKELWTAKSDKTNQEENAE
jgi:CRISPR-associated protein Csd1